MKGASTPPLGEALDERGERAWFVGFVVVAALLVRALYLLSIRDAPFFLHLQTEPARYDAWAQDIVRGVAPFRPPLDEAPAYPYFVAAVYACVGHRVVAVAALQAALDACSAGAVALFARRVLGARAGWVAGALYAAYGPLVYFTGQLEPATLGVLAVSVALTCTPTRRGAGDAASLRAWTWAGVAWAATLVVRSEMIFALPVVAFAAARAGGRPAALRALAAPSALLAASLTLNLATSGHLVLLTTGSGVNLWIGNNPSADGVSPFLHGPMLVTVHDVEARARDAVEADALFRGHAWAFVRDEPAHALHLLVRRLVWLFADSELPNAADIAWQTAQSWLFASPVVPLRFGPVFAAALAGLVLRKEELRRAVVLAAPVAVAISVAALFFTNARFRLVMSPTLLVLAAGGLDGVIDAGRARGAHADPPKRRLVRGGVAFLVGAIVAFSGFEGVRSYRIDEIDQNNRAIGVRAPTP